MLAFPKAVALGAHESTGEIQAQQVLDRDSLTPWIPSWSATLPSPLSVPPLVAWT